MNTRLLTRNDAQQYKDLRLQALRVAPECFLATYQQEAKKNINDFGWELSSCLRSATEGYYGVFEDNQLIAYLQASKTGLQKQDHIIFLFNLYVSIDHRRKKIAHHLVQHIITQIIKNDLEVEIIRVSHVKSNHPAHQLYQNLGFATESIQKNMIKDNGKYDDQIDMVLNIQK